MVSEVYQKELLDRFGYSSLRPGQEAVIDSVLARRDTFAMLPTGTGKSLCYQLPAYLMKGLTVIITPLISLMQDQVDHLRYIGEKQVAAINGSLSQYHRNQIMANVVQLRFLFLSPEMAVKAQIIRALKKVQIAQFVVDEAHCISQWGPDFRPEYLQLGALRHILKPSVSLAMTATATPEVQKDIIEKLGMNYQETNRIVFSVDRPNIYLGVKQVINDKEKQNQLLSLLDQLGGSGIIYFSSRKKAEEVAQKIQAHGNQNAAYYHGQMDYHDRFVIQQQFLQNRLQVICATNAFGMGVDKPNIKFVIHYHMSASLENYLQEIGRCGRDGKSAIAILLYQNDDFYLQSNLITSDLPTSQLISQYYNQPKLFEHSTEDPAIELVRFYHHHHKSEQDLNELITDRISEKNKAIAKMRDYVQLKGCRREFLVRYFEPEAVIQHFEHCCDDGIDNFMIPQDLVKSNPDSVKITSQKNNWESVINQLFD